MTDIFNNLALGFSVALSLKNVMLCFLGCLIGTLVGVLPGVGPIATIAILLPITLTLDPVGALIMLAGIYYGAQYGGSTTAILVNIPGEATSVVTALDGHEMAKRGQAGVALGLSAMASFIAGTIATIFIAAIGAPLTALGLLFGPAEYFSLMVMGLTFAVVLAHGSVLKAVAMIVVGVLLSTVGTDIETGRERLSFDIGELSDGIDFAVIAMGIFGFAEIMRNLADSESREVVKAAIGNLLPSRELLWRCLGPVLRELGWARSLAFCQETVLYLHHLLHIPWRRRLLPIHRASVAGRPKVWLGRGGKQCRGSNFFYPSADAWHPAKCGYGTHGGGNANSRNCAWPSGY